VHFSSKRERQVFPFTSGNHLTHIVSVIKALSSQEFLGVAFLPSVSIYECTFSKSYLHFSPHTRPLHYLHHRGRPLIQHASSFTRSKTIRLWSVRCEHSSRSRHWRRNQTHHHAARHSKVSCADHCVEQPRILRRFPA